ncbi:MAG TPA: TerC family protein [Chloroflexota bacterium]|jgi:predicted tellurium resistance membrane protein TerC|nr:TerC family protein [Chloroflexota bacterium]
MLESLFTADALVALVTLTVMEIVLGIDNVVFLSILAGRLPADQQQRARTIGLSLALIMRIGLLLAISWVLGLTAPLFAVFGHDVSGRDLILLAGGLFLIYKATTEIYEKLEVHLPEDAPTVGRASFGATIVQILIMDIVFSLDSVITAVGMASQIIVMVLAMIVAVGVMLVTAAAISDFVERHPSVKILALSFLLLIGVMLVAEGSGRHIEKAFVYAAMAFSLFVEMLNMRFRARQREALVLHRRFEHEGPGRTAEPASTER